MVTRTRTWPAVLLGAACVVVGVLVLRSRAARAEVGWFSYDAPPPQELLDGLVAWNPTRAAGAALVMLGLLVLAHRLGVVVRVRGLAPPRVAGPALVLAGVLVVGGLVAFVLLGAAERANATVAISRFRPQQVTYGSTAWTPDQAAAALVVATGLVLAAVGAGLRRRRAS